MSERPFITHAQAQAAMSAMLKKAMEQPHRPVAMAIVDDAGILLAYQQMDGPLRLFTRRHAIRKAYTAAVSGMNTSAFAELMKSRNQTIREIGGDLELTPGAGGVVVRLKRHEPKNHEEFHVNVMGGIGVGGYFTGAEDEQLATVGLNAMGL